MANWDLDGIKTKQFDTNRTLQSISYCDPKIGTEVSMPHGTLEYPPTAEQNLDTFESVSLRRLYLK